uniref:FLZ-type domain-containing protein n=1 Tax=Kalanchoe fedtschenkoi TaxID=63787 RepID=A0A7N0ZTW3_KALFE
MADSPTPQLSHTFSYSSFGSPRTFSYKGKFDSADSTGMSPTSLLDSTSLFSTPKNPFCTDLLKPIKTDGRGKLLSHCWESKGVGLALIHSEPECRAAVLFRFSQIKIHNPTTIKVPTESPGDYGTKSSPSSTKRTMSGWPKVLSAAEMLMSEDYTRVICRGPNPRTTHIFEDRVVESCCGVVQGLSSEKESALFCIGEQEVRLWSESCLSFCGNCRKKLEVGTDIYMFRGEKAFCSEECRAEEMSKLGCDDEDVWS